MKRSRLWAAAIIVAALFAVGPTGVAGADPCGGFGPYSGSNCGPNNNNNGDLSQSGGSSWPPDTNSGYTWPPSINSSSGGVSTSSGGGSTHATPIVPVSSGR